MTGLSPQNGDSVIEISSVAIEGQRIVDEFGSLIDVDNRISLRIKQVSDVQLCLVRNNSHKHITLR